MRIFFKKVITHTVIVNLTCQFADSDVYIGPTPIGPITLIDYKLLRFCVFFHIS